MATLTLRRSDRWFDFGRWRTLFIQIGDGSLIPLVPLRSGEEKSISLPPGLHTVVAGMDWGRSEPLEIELREEEPKRVTVRSRLFTSWLNVPPFNIFRLQEAASPQNIP